MPPLTVVEPLYKFVPLRVNVPPLPLTRFTRPCRCLGGVADHPGKRATAAVVDRQRAVGVQPGVVVQALDRGQVVAADRGHRLRVAVEIQSGGGHGVANAIAAVEAISLSPPSCRMVPVPSPVSLKVTLPGMATAPPVFAATSVPMIVVRPE